MLCPIEKDHSCKTLISQICKIIFNQKMISLDLSQTSNLYLKNLLILLCLPVKSPLSYAHHQMRCYFVLKYFQDWRYHHFLCWDHSSWNQSVKLLGLSVVISPQLLATNWQKVLMLPSQSFPSRIWHLYMLFFE